MSRARRDQLPKLELGIWKVTGDKYTVDKADLQDAVDASPNPREVIRDRMGRGFVLIEEAMNGKVMTIWNVKHIEWGLEPDAKVMSKLFS